MTLKKSTKDVPTLNTEKVFQGEENKYFLNQI